MHVLEANDDRHVLLDVGHEGVLVLQNLLDCLVIAIHVYEPKEMASELRGAEGRQVTKERRHATWSAWVAGPA
jgi:hypothetical protein